MSTMPKRNPQSAFTSRPGQLNFLMLRFPGLVLGQKTRNIIKVELAHAQLLSCFSDNLSHRAFFHILMLSKNTFGPVSRHLTTFRSFASKVGWPYILYCTSAIKRNVLFHVLPPSGVLCMLNRSRDL